MSTLLKAKVKSSNKVVEVYKSALRNTYIDFSDCKTEYTESELIFNI